MQRQTRSTFMFLFFKLFSIAWNDLKVFRHRPAEDWQDAVDFLEGQTVTVNPPTTTAHAASRRNSKKKVSWLYNLGQ